MLSIPFPSGAIKIPTVLLITAGYGVKLLFVKTNLFAVEHVYSTIQRERRLNMNNSAHYPDDNKCLGDRALAYTLRPGFPTG